jgi:hypothetical protein
LKVRDNGALLTEIELGFFVNIIKEIGFCGIEFPASELGDETRNYLIGLLEGQQVELQTYPTHTDGWVATVYLNGQPLNPVLVARGLATSRQKKHRGE